MASSMALNGQIKELEEQEAESQKVQSSVHLLRKKDGKIPARKIFCLVFCQSDKRICT